VSDPQDDTADTAHTVLDLKSARLSREDAPTERAETAESDAPTQEATAEATEWKSLHPASLAVNLIPRAWRTLRAAWPLVLALVIGSGSMGMRAADLMILLFFAGLSGANTFIHWMTLRYRMHGERLEIKSGLINRQSRTIDPARIQNMELVENLFHKFAGLVELRIETAGGTSTEGLLSALSKAEANELRSRLAGVGSISQENEAASEAEPILTMSLAEIIAYGLTRRTVGTVAVLTAIGLEVMGQMDPNAAQDLTQLAGPAMIFAAFLIAFAGSWVLSAGASFFSNYGFKLERTGESIRTVSGLTTQRRVEIPLAKVQLVRADEPLMRRMMGYGTIEIETAGLGVQEGQVRTAEGVIPMVDADELGAIVKAAAPLVSTDPWSAELKPAHPRALWRAATAGTIQAVLVAIPAFIFLDVLGWAALALNPLSVINAWFDWNWQGWLVTEHAIISRHGFLNRQTYVLARDKLQSVHMVQGPLMRLHGLGRVVVRVAGSQVALPDISKKDAARVMAALTA
jgi:putative membrane protein